MRTHGKARADVAQVAVDVIHVVLVGGDVHLHAGDAEELTRERAALSRSCRPGRRT